MQPNDIYLRSKRSLLFFSGALLLSVLVGIKIDDNGSNVNIFPVSISDTTYLNWILVFVAIYFLIQISLFWFAQNSEIRQLTQYRFDFYISVVIGFVACIIFAANTFPRARTPFIIGIAILMPILLFSSRSIILRGQQRRKHIENKILPKLLDGNWTLIFNPRTQRGSKPISFLSDGNIGDGQNQNETVWRLRGDFLEILNLKGEVFSRFKYNEQDGIFRHTNDDDTLSIRSQKIVPRTEAASSR